MIVRDIIKDVENGSKRLIFISNFTGIIYLRTIWQNDIPESIMSAEVYCVEEYDDCEWRIFIP